MIPPDTISVRYPTAGELLAALDLFWGAGAWFRWGPDPSVVYAACPACRSKALGRQSLSRGYPVQIVETIASYYALGRCECSETSVIQALDRARPVYMDSAEQLAALLDAATDLDARSTARTTGRRALIAALAFGGLRIGEACALTWGDVDLANGRLHVGHSKTDAGVREVDLLPLLRDELATYRGAEQAAGRGAAADLVFTTAAGTPRDKDNARSKVMRPVVARADELLAERGQAALPAGLTPHKLRHGFASVLVAIGRDPAYVMGQLGHADARFTLTVYSHAMRRGEDERERLRVLVEGGPVVTTGVGKTASAISCP